ncbi:MAG: DUF4390 domain-containing protein [Pseudomonadota bacterium]|nr:DUF4390 domain-containing protein [Pseudomonadota bacterium]
MTRPPPLGPLRRRSLLRGLGVAALRGLPLLGFGATPKAAPAPTPGSAPASAAPASAAPSATAATSTAVPGSAAAGPRLVHFDVNRDEDGVHLAYAVDFDLGHGVDDAFGKSVPLFFVAEAEIYRDRWYWRDRRVAHAVRTWRVVYQPLTSTYRVTTIGGLSQTYSTRADALASISRSSNWKVAEPGQIDDGHHYIEFQFRLDTTQLPRPMQIGISGEPDWQLSIKRTQRIN